LIVDPCEETVLPDRARDGEAPLARGADGSPVKKKYTFGNGARKQDQVREFPHNSA
jgi:hypothetical protein